MPRLRVALVAAIALTLSAPGPVLAWSDHAVMTRDILRPLSWLNQFRQIKVTAWSYAGLDNSPLSPDYKPVYLDALVGETTTAREILLRYVDEPDWGMDVGVEASPLQRLSGSSQAYRHRCDHFLNGAVRVGGAPARVKACYELARLAFAKKDPYWGFRFLAQSLHYLEDMGDPYRTAPFQWKQLLANQLNFGKLSTLNANLRTFYEALITHWLRRQSAAGGGPLVAAIADAEPADIRDPQDAAIALADFTNRRADALMTANDHFWPKRVHSTKALLVVRPTDLDPPEPPPSMTTIMEITALDLHVTAKMARGLLNLAKRELLAPPRTDDDE